MHKSSEWMTSRQSVPHWRTQLTWILISCVILNILNTLTNADKHTTKKHEDNRTSLNTLPIQRRKMLSRSERPLEELSWDDDLLFATELSSFFLCSSSWPCPASWHVPLAAVDDVVTTIKVKIRISVSLPVQVPLWKSGQDDIPQGFITVLSCSSKLLTLSIWKIISLIYSLDNSRVSSRSRSSADLDVSRDVCLSRCSRVRATDTSDVAASPPLLFKEKKRAIIGLIESVDEFVDDVSMNQVQSFLMSCIRCELTSRNLWQRIHKHSERTLHVLISVLDIIVQYRVE